MEKKIETEELVDLGAVTAQTKGGGPQNQPDESNPDFKTPVALSAD
ncbi:hypothetical protein ATDW_36540 (plasmid) [Asticcacaulis sp. DW145]|nr:hypothetical protein ATDW_36540 [Asticcacaulis sp. DW145]